MPGFSLDLSNERPFSADVAIETISYYFLPNECDNSLNNDIDVQYVTKSNNIVPKHWFLKRGTDVPYRGLRIDFSNLFLMHEKVSLFFQIT